MNAQALSLNAEGDGEWISEDVQTILGRPPRSYQQVASDYVGAFS